MKKRRRQGTKRIRESTVRGKVLGLALRTGLVILMVLALCPLVSLAANAAGAAGASSGDQGDGVGQGLLFTWWLIAVAGSLSALACAWMFYKKMMAADAGNPRMVEIAGFVREGANAYLRQQYKVVAYFFVAIVILLAIAAYGLGVQSGWVPFAFLTGGFFSGLAGWFGMKTATWASSRTTAGAQKSLNQGLQIAFRSGAVMGLTVVGLGLLDICLWFAVLYWLVGPEHGMNLVTITVTMLCFGMGASTQALFARVGGGIFTKAADVGADLVGKVEHGIPEDDPRNPATIADNVGDNVGDVAGMGADLYESYCGSILATAALGVAAFSNPVIQKATSLDAASAQLSALFLPIVIAGVGIFLSIAGIFMVRTEEDASQRTLLRALARGINCSTALVIVAAIVFSMWLMPDVQGTKFLGIPGVALSIIFGLLAGWSIGKWTEYSTSNEYRPTKWLADQAVTGPATVIIGGVAEGMMSVWAPVAIVCLGTILAFGSACGWQFNDMNYFALGLYGVGIAAVGMLSTLGITLATDAYGPIADNAGGNAQMAELDPLVRERTDALDSLGNTTAATGKGFAIGSAALTALALLAAYVEEVRIGFERWGDAVVAQKHLEADAFYKASPGFVVYKFATKDETTGKEQLKAATFLAPPSATRDPRINVRWKNLSLKTGPAQVPDEWLEVKKGADGMPLEVKLKDSGAALISVPSATLPDFTDYYDASLMNPKVLIGVFLGAMAIFVFCALTMKAVGRAAKGMVEEVRRQFREKPGIMEGKDRPDYAQPVAISTKAAQKEMIVPSVLALVLPVAVGLVLGVGGVMGLLVGTLTTGFCVAIFMANAGGSWDNAKKHIEAGAHGGKYLKNAQGQFINAYGTPVITREEARNPIHGAAVIGDTVGDPFKDTSGPSLNILIKLMSMVSVVVAGLIVRYSLVALGIF
jgi:K(+)-stimulated pyrophosphate-energized sodium pump